MGSLAKDCSRKLTTQCSKCDENGHLGMACKRQRGGGKHESVATSSRFSVPDKKYCAALTPWKTAYVLVDIGCTVHIVTNTDALLDFVPTQSVVRNLNGEDSRVVDRG